MTVAERIDGDLMGFLTALNECSDPTRGPGITMGIDTTAAIARAAIPLGALGPPPRRPVEEPRLGGRLHTRRRDARAIAHHYDVGNDFYRLILGPSLVYSCAYYEEEPGDAYGLDEAQRSKLDHVARKLGLQPGMRLLDVGCGWGPPCRRHRGRTPIATGWGVRRRVRRTARCC